jgi:heme exporter protein C
MTAVLPSVATKSPGLRSPSSTPRTRVLGIVTLAALVTAVVLALFVTPDEATQKTAVRMLYVHVGLISAAYQTLIACGVLSALVLWKKQPGLDRFAGAAGEVATVLLGVFLFTGMLWGHLTWGVWWSWDPRITTTALLFVILCGYLAVRGLDGSPTARMKRSAIVALIGVAQIPIINQSVNWWRSLHQDTTLQQRDIEMDGIMLFSTFFAVVACSLLAFWLVLHRARLAWLNDEGDSRALEAAIEARRGDGSGA